MATDPSGWDRYAGLIGSAGPAGPPDDGWDRYQHLVYGQVETPPPPAPTGPGSAAEPYLLPANHVTGPSALPAPAQTADMRPEVPEAPSALLDAGKQFLGGVAEGGNALIRNLNTLAQGDRAMRFDRKVADAIAPHLPDAIGGTLRRWAYDPLPSETLAQNKDAIEAWRGAPQGVGGALAGLLGRLGFEGASAIATGGLASEAVGLPAATSLLGRVAQTAVGSVPYDVLNAQNRDTSITGAAADLTGNPALDAVADSRLGRSVVDPLLGLGTGTALEEGARGVKALRSGDLLGVGKDVAAGIDEGARSATDANAPAAADVFDRERRQPPESYQTGRRLLASPAPEPVRPDFIAGPSGVRRMDDLVQPAGYRVRETVKAPDAYEVAQQAEEQGARDLEAARAQQVAGQEKVRASAEDNLAVRQRLGALGLDYSGHAAIQAIPGVAGAAGGAVVGAENDPEHPLEGGMKGALVGGIGGLALGTGARALMQTGAKEAAPAYLSDPDVQGVLSTISSGERSTTKALRARLGEAGTKLYTRLVDDLHPLKQFGRQVEGSDRLAQESSRARGWQAAAEERLRTDFKPVLEASAGNDQGATALATAERALELAKNGMPEKGVDLNQARATVEKLGGVPEVRKAADALRGYYRSLLDYKLANGVITNESYDRIVQSGEFYVPFMRDLEDEGLQVTSAGGGRLVNRGTGVRKMEKGAVQDLKILDPYQQAILDTMEAERTVAKQRVTNLVSQIVENNPEGAAPFIVKVKNGADAKGPGYVQANVGGERQAYKVTDPELYDAWAAFDPHTQTVFTRMLRPFKAALQTGVTMLPDFAVANALRDNSMSAIQYGKFARQSLAGSAVGAVAGAATDPEDRVGGAERGALYGMGAPMVANLARSLSAMRSLLKNDELYQEWVKEGGAGFGFYTHDHEGARKVLKQLKSSGVDLGDVLSPKSWWHAFEAINHAVEQAPRLARYKSLRASGAEIPEAVAASRDISLDFRRIGKDMKGLAQANAFLNAQVQGWDKLGRMLKDKKTWAAGAAMLTAPSIALWQTNHADPERSAAYDARPDWEKNMFWLVPKGGPDEGFWRIPKPFEIGWVFGSVPERLLDFAAKRDPETLKHGLMNMASTYGVSNLLPLSTAATPIIENVANYDFFRNRPIVSEAEQRLPADMQYSERTSSLAVKLGGALGVSPEKVDHLIQGWTGSAGQTGLDMSTAAAKKAGLDTRPDAAPGRAPLVGRFSTRPDQTSDAEQMLFDRYSAGEQARAGFQELGDRGAPPEEIQAYVEKHRGALEDFFTLKQQAESLSQIRRLRRMVRESDWTSEEKGRALTRLASLAEQAATNPQGDALALQP